MQKPNHEIDEIHQNKGPLRADCETIDSKHQLKRFAILVFVYLVYFAVCSSCVAAEESSRYTFREEHSRDGIGKFYMGREIAHVMGHQAADWLERPERAEEEGTDLLMEKLPVRLGEVVADIGAGTGYFTRRLAKVVGEKGEVLAVDIQPEMLDLLTNKMAELKIKNVKPILGTIADPKLPSNRVDLVLLVDVYHEFSHPFEMMENISKSLRPDGRVVFVEFRGEDPNVPIKPLHKMTEAQVRKEMSVHPLEWVQTITALPRQHIMIFKKKT
jgi:SAM-dependent methyltransferase